MTNIIEELYLGNIAPADKGFMKGSEIDRLNRAIVNQEEVLLKTLEGKEKQLLEKLSNSYWEINGLTAQEFFTSGFCLGTKLLATVFAEPPSNLKDIG